MTQTCDSCGHFMPPSTTHTACNICRADQWNTNPATQLAYLLHKHKGEGYWHVRR